VIVKVDRSAARVASRVVTESSSPNTFWPLICAWRSSANRTRPADARTVFRTPAPLGGPDGHTHRRVLTLAETINRQGRCKGIGRAAVQPATSLNRLRSRRWKQQCQVGESRRRLSRARSGRDRWQLRAASDGRRRGWAPMAPRASIVMPQYKRHRWPLQQLASKGVLDAAAATGPHAKPSGGCRCQRGVCRVTANKLAEGRPGSRHKGRRSQH